MKSIPLVEIVLNENPKGCNQYTGPDCSDVDSEKVTSPKVVRDEKGAFQTEFRYKDKDYVFQSRPGFNKAWEVVFSEKNKTGVLESYKKDDSHEGTSAVPILRAVSKSIEYLIKARDPDKFFFSAWKSEPSRVSLYRKAAELISKRNNYELTEEDTHYKSAVSFFKPKEPIIKFMFKKKPGVTNNSLTLDEEFDTSFEDYDHSVTVNVTSINDRNLLGMLPEIITVNLNEKGCNQWTGPDCDGSTSIGDKNGSDRVKTKFNSGGDEQGLSNPSRSLEGKTRGPGYQIKDAKQGDYNKSFDTGLVKAVPKKGISLPALDKTKGTKVLEWAKNRYVEAGHEEMGSWFDRVISQVKKVGTDKVLEQLGPRPLETETKEKVLYQGHDFGHETKRIAKYLESNGIILAGKKNDNNLRLVSALIKDFKPVKENLTRKDFIPKAPASKNKLEESQALPGLESTKDVSDVIGKPVTALTPDVTKKFDKEYGKGKWIVKAYGDEAFQSFGIFFPQRIDQLRKEAKMSIWSASTQLERFGFDVTRGKDKIIDGIKNTKTGEEFKFKGGKYNKEIKGDLKVWADEIKENAKEEHGPSLPVKEFMVQPAFPVVGVSDKARADGEIINYGQESRVHIVTKNGKVEAVPYATLIKGEFFPIVVDTEDTKAMVKAAIAAIEHLPEGERKGQIYAPDVIKTKDGYRVVEANPANDVGSSGWLSWNEQIIDAYVSHLMGREPKHVQYIRGLLEDKREAQKALGDKYWGSVAQPYYHKGANPTSDAAIIRENKKGEKEILLIQRSKKKGDGTPNVEGGKWALPGGFHTTIAAPGETFIKSGETPRAAALRELQEETKLNLGQFKNKLKKVGTYEGGGRDPRDNKESWSQSHAFVLKLPKGFNTGSIKGSDDARKAKWVSIKDLPKMKLAFDHQQIIKDALNRSLTSPKRISASPLRISKGKKVTNNMSIPNVEIITVDPIKIITNAFCPTGKGGGIDSSCGKEGSSKSKGGKSSSKGKESISKISESLESDVEKVSLKEKPSRSKGVPKVEESKLPPINPNDPVEKAWRKDMEKEMTPEQHKELYKEKENTVPRVDLAKKEWAESQRKEMTAKEWEKLYGNKK